MLETGGPVSAFADALLARDLARACALLAPGVELSVPPLHYVSSGLAEVGESLTGLLGAFGDVRYDVRSRYLAPGSVTDEAVLGGRQTGPFLGALPTRRAASVPVRVIVEHNERLVTRITVWPELAALRAAVAGADRVIDLTRTTETGGAIASLRASMPPRPPRVIVGESRIPPVPGAGPSDTLGAAEDELVVDRVVPKPPVPKTVRRRRALLAGGTMLVAAGVLATWVTVGAFNLPDSSVHPTPLRVQSADVAAANGTGRAGADGPGRTGAADTTGTGDAAGANGSSGGSSGGSAQGSDGSGDGTAASTSTPPATQLASGNDTVVMSSDLLFATNSAKLTAQARRDLQALIDTARRQPRPGTVTVSGYTDDRGSTAYNLELSKRRAAAVAAVLRQGLAGRGMVVRSKGYGETRPAEPNDTPEGRQANRRVTVKFPPVQGARGPGARISRPSNGAAA